MMTGAPVRPDGLLILSGLLAGACLLTACARPIGITPVTPEESYLAATRSPLSGEGLSDAATRVLHRHNLLDLYESDPRSAIRQLIGIARVDPRRDLLFALAEASYDWGEQLAGGDATRPGTASRRRDAFLQSAVFAYLFLLGPGADPPPGPYDNRFRDACEIYNRALDQGFRIDGGERLRLATETRGLLVGSLPIDLKTDNLAWKLTDFKALLPADAYEVHGFTSHNRTPGLGLPMIAVSRLNRDAPNGGALPITAFLRVEGGVPELTVGRGRATLELYSGYDDPGIRVNGQSVPLQIDTTAPLAYRLDDPDIWSIGLKRFIFGGNIDNHVLLIQPYHRGRIPVVLVHGTGSSPVWWADMVNSLRNDPAIRKAFQFWFYEYTSNLPVLVSGADLRDTLSSMVEHLDPRHQDPALREMVVIGHSQGGLLTHLTAVDPGDRLWRSISDRPPSRLDTDPEIRASLERALVFRPLPFVSRVIFISTPHRGSFLTKSWVRNLASRLLTLPADLVMNGSEKFRQLTGQLRLPPELAGHMPTSIDGMSPDNPVLKSLATLPLAPGVTGHSIIAVEPGQDIRTGNDGVVEYASAHLDGMVSEYVVRTGHSAQGHPLTIEEVRRILLAHESATRPLVAGSAP